MLNWGILLAGVAIGMLLNGVIDAICSIAIQKNRDKMNKKK